MEFIKQDHGSVGLMRPQKNGSFNFALKKYLFFLMLMLVLGPLLYVVPEQQSLLSIATSSLIILISSLGIVFGNDYPFSLRSTVLIFTYFFFGVVPIVTNVNDITYWGASSFNDYDYFFTNLLILLFLAVFFLIDFLLNSMRKPKKINSKVDYWHRKNIYLGKYYSATLVVISAIVLGYKFSIFGYDFSSLLTAGRLGDGNPGDGDGSQIQNLIFYWFITPILSICLILQLQAYKRINFQTVLLFLFLILAASPLSMSRFGTAVMYMPIIFFSRALFIFPVYNLILFFSLFIIFPLLNLLRKPDFFLILAKDFYAYWISLFSSGDFDAYQSLMLVVKHDLVTYGYQFLGPLLFFIPRSLWPEKPVGSGDYLSTTIGLTFDNISASLITEGYINFGVLGVCLYGIILGALVSKFDYKFWNCSSRKASILTRVRYIYSIPAFFFMMRGDLMSSISSFVGILLALEIIYFIIHFQIRWHD
jgi:oligosaccharide repeat unit polymerase